MDSANFLGSILARIIGLMDFDHRNFYSGIKGIIPWNDSLLYLSPSFVSPSPFPYYLQIKGLITLIKG